MPDDQRNIVDSERNICRLYREHAQRLVNGVTVGKLMLALRKVVIKHSKRPFTLDPTLGNLQEKNIPQARQYNWGVIISELKKFGIKVSKDQQRALTEGSHAQVEEILRKLSDYDDRVQAQQRSPERGTSQEKAKNDLPLKGSLKTLSPKADINSEINFGTS